MNTNKQMCEYYSLLDEGELQIKDSEGGWKNVTNKCYLILKGESYRGTPATRMIGGREVPDCIKELPKDLEFFYTFDTDGHVYSTQWEHDVHIDIFRNGLVFATKQAAEMNYSALTRLTKLAEYTT